VIPTSYYNNGVYSHPPVVQLMDAEQHAADLPA
jgi:hypothetical protein